jgi:hypothetical protein
VTAGRRQTAGRALIEELPTSCRACGAPLFQLSRGDQVAWVRCLAGHRASTRAPLDFTSSASSSRRSSPLGWHGRNGGRRVAQLVSQPILETGAPLLPNPGYAASIAAAQRD